MSLPQLNGTIPNTTPAIVISRNQNALGPVHSSNGVLTAAILDGNTFEADNQKPTDSMMNKKIRLCAPKGLVSSPKAQIGQQEGTKFIIKPNNKRAGVTISPSKD